MTITIVPAKAEYDRRNEAEFRAEVERKIGQSYDRRGDLIVPLGKRLAFTSPQGQVITFGYDQDGNFTVQNDAGVSLINLTDDSGATELTDDDGTTELIDDSQEPVIMASIGYVQTVEASLNQSIATLETEISAEYQASDASLSAAITQEATTRSAADTSAAIRITNLETTVDTPTTGLSARVTVAEGAITTLDGSVASVSSEIVAARSGQANLNARINAESTARTNADSALAVRASSLETTINTPTTGLTARVGTAETTITTLDGAVSGISSEISAARNGEANLNARITAEETARATGDSANATSITTLSSQVSQRFTSLSVADFVADGLFWTTASGGSPSAVANPSSQVTYADVAGVGRVARVDLTSGNIYLQPKAVLQPQVNRKYRLRCRAKVHANASGGGTLAFAFYINGMNSSYTHTDPSSDWSGAADGSRPSSDASFVEADGVVNFGRIITCTAVSSNSAYWRPRIDLTRSGGSGGVIEVREFLIEEITDIDTLTASVTTNASAITAVDGKLTASYGVTVDGNGRIASMKLLSDGTTSSVKFKTDTFQIYNNVTDVAVFDVTGSQIRMVADLNVAAGITVGSARLKVGLESIRKTGADGAAITWANGSSIGNIPEYVLDLSSLDALASGEQYSVYLTSVTATGATVYAKIVTPGATSTVTQTTDAAGGGGAPTRVMAKTDNADAYDGVYNFRVIGTVTVTSAYEGELSAYVNSGLCTISTWFNDGGGWDEGPSIEVVYFTIGADEAGAQAFDVTAAINWGNAIGAGGTYDFGVTADSGGTVTDLHTVSYIKQTSTGLRTASPNSETVKITAFPRNA